MNEDEVLIDSGVLLWRPLKDLKVSGFVCWSVVVPAFVGVCGFQGFTDSGLQGIGSLP